MEQRCLQSLDLCVAVSNHPNVNNITDTTVESSSSNPKKRARPNDQSPLSEGCATSKEGIGSLEVQFDSQDRRYIVVSCAGRPGKLFLNKFYKLQGNKGFEKCIEYNSKLLAPQEFESACGMKVMMAWKKYLKHKSLPLLDYISSGLLVEFDPTSAVNRFEKNRFEKNRLLTSIVWAAS